MFSTLPRAFSESIIVSVGLLAFPFALLGAELPPESPGQKVAWRIDFATPEISPEEPAGFDLVSEGRLLGRLPNGPAWRDGDEIRQWSAAARHQVDGEDPTTVTFHASRSVGEENLHSGMVSFWIRPSGRQHIRGAAFLQLIMDRPDHGSTPIFSAKLESPMGDPFLELVPQSAEENARTSIPYDEWTLVWVAYERRDKEGKIEFWSQSGPGETPQLLSVQTTTWPWQVDRVLVSFSRFAGRVGPLTFYQLESMDSAKHAPGGFIWPDNARTTWTVVPDGESNYEKRILGGWDGLRRAMQDAVVLGRMNKAWTDAEGNHVGYRTLGDAQSKKQWWLDWVDGKYQPMADRVEFQPGVYRVRGELARSHGGIQYTLVEGAEDFSADLRMSEVLTGEWKRPDPEKFPRIWRYDGEPLKNRHVWGKDWQSFLPASNPEGLSALLPLMNDRPWSATTDPEGITYISLPDGTTPEQIGPLEGSTPIGLMWSGSWLGKLLIQGGAMYEHDKEWGAGTLAGYALGISTGPEITIIEGRGLRCSKHPAVVVGGHSTGLCIWYHTDVGFDPPGKEEDDPKGFGVGTGGFTPLVDYSSASTTEENPGSIVTIYDNVTYREPTEPGDGTTNARPARRPMYYAHGSGGNSHMFALTIFRNPGPEMFAPDARPGTPPHPNHVAIELIPGPDTPFQWTEE